MSATTSKCLPPYVSRYSLRRKAITMLGCLIVSWAFVGFLAWGSYSAGLVILGLLKP